MPPDQQAKLTLYSYFRDFLASKIDAHITKKVFLLAIYDFLTEEISFTDLLYTVNELGFHLNKYGDLIQQDHNLATTFLDLDEINIKDLSEKKTEKYKDYLNKYYSSLVSDGLYIREKILDKYVEEIPKDEDFSSVRTFLAFLIEGYRKNKITLGETVAIIRKIYFKVCKVQKTIKPLEKDSYPIYLLGAISGLIPNLFLKPTESEKIKNFLREIELISSRSP